MPESSAIIRVSGGYVDSTGKFWPTGGGILSGNTGGQSSSWNLGSNFLSGFGYQPPATSPTSTSTSPQVSTTTLVSGGGSGASSPEGNIAFDEGRNDVELNGQGMSWRLNLPNLIPNINQEVTVGGGGGIVQALRNPSFWLQVAVVVVGGMTLFWLTKGKAQ